ncbi:hypothetical protein LRS06_19665 [Hymenobacter sp. J193]|uniref:hypothetical protein n=1 Tax=Hymenobacter sp. J193 TaxID=2898429 RepID=UPI002151AD52|nr:hypothetical protein [Hymenobacter sp. J193]MCR5889949.1 hypothetical protein [Hymenobacter sp. J193]
MYYDIYGLSAGRDEDTVERFLAHFCDRTCIEPLVNKSLYVWQNDKYNTPEVFRPLHSIAELIAYAVANPNHLFNFYNHKGLRDDVFSTIIQFTNDGKVVFGISVWYDTDEGSDTYEDAYLVEAEIRQVTGAYKSCITVEYPPARDEEEFDEDVAMWKDMHDSFERDNPDLVIR